MEITTVTQGLVIKGYKVDPTDLDTVYSDAFHDLGLNVDKDLVLKNISYEVVLSGSKPTHKLCDYGVIKDGILYGLDFQTETGEKYKRFIGISSVSR